MAINYDTTTHLVASIKRRGMLPTNAGTFTEADYLAIATEEQNTYIASAVHGMREEHSIATLDRTIVAGTASYEVPPRAVGAGLRDVLYVDASGREHSLARLEPEMEVSLDFSSSGSPEAFVLEGNSVILVPTPSQAGTLRLKYPRTFNRLVPVSECATITNIDRNANTITVSGIPATFVSGERYDLVRGTAHFDVLAMDLPATVAGSVLTVTGTIPDAVAVGDFVGLAGQTCVPNFVKELHPVLACRVAAMVNAARDDKRARGLFDICEAMLTRNVAKLMQPRTPGASRKIVNRYGPGF